MAQKTQDYWNVERLTELMKDIIGDGQFGDDKFHNAASFLRYLNQALFTVASRLPPEVLDELLACDPFIPTTSTFSFTPTSPYLKLWFVRWVKDSDYNTLEMIDRAPPEWFDATARNENLGSSTLFGGKHKYIEANGNVCIRPVINDPDGLIEIWYIKRPTRLEQNSDYPELSDEAVGLQVLEACQYAAVKENDWDKVKFLQAKAAEAYAAILGRFRGEEEQRTVPPYRSE